jgi:hypothetical protein
VALLGPSAIAIHDDGDVLGQGVRGFCGHELSACNGGACTLPPFAQKRSLLLSNGNDKFEVLRFLKFVLCKLRRQCPPKVSYVLPYNGFGCFHSHINEVATDHPAPA